MNYFYEIILTLLRKLIFKNAKFSLKSIYSFEKMKKKKQLQNSYFCQTHDKALSLEKKSCTNGFKRENTLSITFRKNTLRVNLNRNNSVTFKQSNLYIDKIFK